MITSDYNVVSISKEELEDLKVISDVVISNITLDDYPNLLVFPDSFENYNRDFGKKKICSIINQGKELVTNSIVGFIGRNNTNLSIHSRFAKNNTEDYFLHYMLQKVSKINLLNLHHTLSEDSIFDFLIYMFPLYLKKAISQGVYKEYITKHHNNANVRGVIDVNRHVRLNEPFNGKVAYSTREYCYDNHVTQLIRHTIEFIKKLNVGNYLLNMDDSMIEAVSQIISSTPSYTSDAKQYVINQNICPMVHPYYSYYTPLQRICLQILRNEELKYGQEKDEIYGVLIDASWLWEEYVAMIIEEKYCHYTYDNSRISLFEDVFQRIIPDYISNDKSIIADAKYIPLKEKRWFGEEKATAIYYKTIAYMYRFCTDQGYLFYPYPDEDVISVPLKIKTEQKNVNGGTITKIGLRIPSRCSSYQEFVNKIEIYEKSFYSKI